ncbi:MAG: hypothetical protein ABI948_10415 [Thermoleophilia bacterium]
MSERKIPVADDVVAARLHAGTSQRALAEEYGGTKTAIAKAAARHRDLQDRVALGESAVGVRERRERRCAKRQGLIAPASRAPENGPPASARLVVDQARPALHADHEH